MSVTSFFKRAYDDEPMARAAVLIRMLLTVLGGALIVGVAVALVAGAVALIWGNSILAVIGQITAI